MDKPVFTDPFYIDKFMEIQQKNIVLYKSILALQNNPETKSVIEKEFGDDFFDVISDCPT